MNRRNIKKSRFTLVELLVSMAVFSVLLLVSMQIFSGSQKLWLASEQNNRVYADVRSAMEFITSRLQTQAYSDGMPFLITNDKMYFPTAMPMNRKKDGKDLDKISMRFIGFDRSADGVLRMSIYSDEGKAASFQKNMPPYAKSKDISGKLFDNAKDHNLIELMDNVVEFKLVPYFLDAKEKNKAAAPKSGSCSSPPYRLDITLTVADSKESFDACKADPDNTDLKDEHCFEFTRSVLFNYRGAE